MTKASFVPSSFSFDQNRVDLLANQSMPGFHDGGSGRLLTNSRVFPHSRKSKAPQRC
jgi:hypothetical protein